MSAPKIVESIEQNNIEFVSFRFTDPRGTWQQITQSVPLLSG